MDPVSFLGSLVSSSPPLIAALLLGIMTSVSPCPLTSNLAALAMLSKKASTHSAAGAASLAYSLGRSVVYVIAAALVGFAGAFAFAVLAPLQAYSSLILSIIFAVCGLLLLEKIRLSFRLVESETLRSLTDKGVAGAFALGAGLALVFCPVSAALFLGGVVPLTISAKDWLLVPAIYGIGTALPVVLFSQAVVLAKKRSGALESVKGAAGAAKALMGALFLLGSAYYLLDFMNLV